MKLFSDCSGPCETCKVYANGATCMAGHGDDDYVYANPEWIELHKEEKEKNEQASKDFIESNRRRLQGFIEEA